MNNSSFFSNINTTLIYTTDYLNNLVQNPHEYQSLIVPDETRTIAERVNILEVQKLYNEFYELSNKIGLM